MRTETQRILRTIGVHEHLPSLADLCADRPPTIEAAFCHSQRCAGAAQGAKPRRKFLVAKNQTWCSDCGSALKWKTLRQERAS